MEQKISSIQFTVLVFMNTLGTAIIFIPTIATMYGRENGWLTLIFATLLGILFILWLTTLVGQEKESNFFEIMDKRVGKFISYCLILLMVSFSFFTTFANIWSIAQFVAIQILMGTPPQALALISTLTCLIAVRYGVEVMVRTAEIFFPFTMISLTLLAVLVWPEAQLVHIQPVMQLNQAGTFVGVIPVLALTYLELMVLLVVMPHVNDLRQAKKAFLIGGGLAGFCMIIVTFAAIAVLGVEGAARHTYSIYVLGQNIQIAEFFERIEVLVAFIWFITIFFKASTNFYFLSIALQHVLKLKNYHSITIPLSMIIFATAITNLPNIFYDFEMMNSTYLILSYITGLTVATILSLARLIGKDKK
ncbi:GerAB/ArcD/ProY family transporter [Amphibacillus jilinensis]|uniref:GerAB/ArcD/ProY family transporter n=1 Tax=Amphibacillus jilinensis TaxID=1216008 RepID=UPI0002F056CD|nr:endospore germination permease [Amphibacillus jilinensis]